MGSIGFEVLDFEVSGQGSYVVFFAPLIPGLAELFHLFRFGFGEVVQLGSVGGKIVQFPGFIIEGDEFPVSGADGSVALVFEVEGSV